MARNRVGSRAWMNSHAVEPVIDLTHRHRLSEGDPPDVDVAAEFSSDISQETSKASRVDTSQRSAARHHRRAGPRRSPCSRALEDAHARRPDGRVLVGRRGELFVGRAAHGQRPTAARNCLNPPSRPGRGIPPSPTCPSTVSHLSVASLGQVAGEAARGDRSRRRRAILSVRSASCRAHLPIVQGVPRRDAAQLDLRVGGERVKRLLVHDHRRRSRN